jgi:hypothetical protein
VIASTYCIIQAALDDGEYVVENRQPARIGTIRNWVELRRLRTVGVSYCGGGADGQKVVVHGKGAAAVADERRRRLLMRGAGVALSLLDYGKTRRVLRGG